MSILLQIIFPFWLLLHNIEQFPALYFPCGSAGKESTCNEGDLGSIPGLARCTGEGKVYPLQYSGLENSMDYTVHGVAKSQTRLSHFHFVYSYHLFLISPVSVRSLPFLSFIKPIFAWNVPLVSLIFLKRLLVSLLVRTHI